MAALTGQRSMAVGKFEISADGTTWVDISNGVIEAAVGGGERPTEVTRTIDGSSYTTTGSPENMTVELSLVYTEGATEPFKRIYDYAVSGGRIDVRFSPDPAPATGDFQFTGTNGRINTRPVPSLDGNSGAAMTVPATWSGPVLVLAVVA
jgi:hypothetical protein